MATKNFIGAAIANFKSVQIVPGANALLPSALISIGLGPYQIQLTGWDSTTLASLWAASPNQLFQQITAVPNGNTLVLTANTAGQDFEVTCTVNGLSTQVSAIQEIHFSATAGTFTLSDGTVTTSAITYSATTGTLVANVLAAINALGGYSSGDVLVTWDSVNSAVNLDFSGGQFAGQSVPLWTGNGASLTGGTAAATITQLTAGNAGTGEVLTVSFPGNGTHTAILNEQQLITMGGSVNSGSLQLSLTGYGTTPAFPFTAGRSGIKNALEYLLGLGTVKTTGGPLAEQTGSGDSTVSGTSLDHSYWLDSGSGSATTSSPILLASSSNASPFFDAMLRSVLAVPQGATIVSAVVSVTRSGSGGTGTDCIVDFYGNAADDATLPANATAGAALVRTSAFTTLPTIPSTGLSGTTYTADVTTLVQEIVNRSGWASGNHLGILVITGGGEQGLSAFTLNVTYSGAPVYSYFPVQVEFIGSMSGINLPQMTTTGLATVSTVQDGGSQTVANIQSGTWSLVLTQTSTSRVFTIASIPYNVTASALQALIVAVMGAGSCTVSGGPAPGTPLVLTFAGAFATTLLAEQSTTAIIGNFGSSASLVEVRSPVAAPLPQNMWDMTVVPGQGTLAVSSAVPLTSRGLIVMQILEPTNVGTTTIDTNVYIPLYDIHPQKIQDSINEAFGQDVVRVTRITHSPERVTLPSATIGSVSQEDGPLHFWFYKDVFRLVFVNSYLASGTISSISVKFIDVSDLLTNSPAGPASWMIPEATPDSGDSLDLYAESVRVYNGFMFSNEIGKPVHLLSCSQVTGIVWSNEYAFRAKLLTQYSATQPTPSVVNRVGLARELEDQAVTFSWYKNLWASDLVDYPAQQIILSSVSVNWDASSEEIQEALAAMTAGIFGEDNVVVTGSLFNSWLSESQLDSPDFLSTYQELKVRLTGALSTLPLQDNGYGLSMTVSNPHNVNFAGMKNVQSWCEPYSVPLPGGSNKRVSFKLATPASVTDVKITVGGKTVDCQPTTTVAQLQALLTSTLGQFPAAGQTFPVIPDRNRVPITVYGTDLTKSVELEFTGFGFQFQEVPIAIGVSGTGEIISITVTQAGVDPVQEVQQLHISGNPVSGTYTVNGSGNIAYNAIASAIQTAVGGPPPTVTGTLPTFFLIWPSSSGAVSLWATTSALNNASLVVVLAQQGGITDGISANIAVSDIISGTGPLYYDSPQNYSDLAVPGCTDTLIFDDATSAVSFGIAQTSVVMVASLSTNKLRHIRNRVVFQNGQKVKLLAAGTAIGGLTASSSYYIINAALDYSFQLSTTPGGSAIDLTSVGNGPQILVVSGLILDVYSRYTGNQIGLPNVNQSASLPEYLPTYLELSGAVADIGIGDGNGLSLLRLDCGTEQAAIHIEASGQSAITNIPALLFLFDNSSSTVQIDDGDVGIAVYTDETSTLGTITATGGSLMLCNSNVDTLNTSPGVAVVERNNNIAHTIKSGG